MSFFINELTKLLPGSLTSTPIFLTIQLVLAEIVQYAQDFKYKMKIKKHYYCITDKYNKPDFRFIFQNRKDAERKIRQIKNSTKGETLFLSKYKRDFFVDGIKRALISENTKLNIRKGCWTALEVKKLSLLENVKPEKLFAQVRNSKNKELQYSKTNQARLVSSGLAKIPAKISDSTFAPFEKVDWDNSFLTTNSFAMAVVFLFVTAIGFVFFNNHKTNNEIAEMMIQTHAQTTQRVVAAQKKALNAKEQELSEQFDEDFNKFVIAALQSFENLKQEEFEKEILKIIKGTPMEKMSSLIAKQDRTVSAFLVGIAKKESNFGKRVPVLNGEDCFNYWGYRGIRDRMGSGGHTCFNSREDAIETVAGRLERLVKADVDTPQEMVLWKCGSACNSDPNAQKWISDVNIYFSQLEEGNS